MTMQTYSIEGSDLCLVATSELALAGYYQMCALPPESLPVRMVAFSHCFRAEAGGTVPPHLPIACRVVSCASCACVGSSHALGSESGSA
jgi:hypothetical protein